MAIPVCNGTKICGGITIGTDTIDLSTLEDDKIHLQPDEVAFNSESTIVIIYDK